jgi:hypothetical protein
MKIKKMWKFISRPYPPLSFSAITSKDIKYKKWTPNIVSFDGPEQIINNNKIFELMKPCSFPYTIRPLYSTSGIFYFRGESG